MPTTVSSERMLLATPTDEQSAAAVRQATRLWQRTLPIWAHDCLILQARGLRDPKWSPFGSPDMWMVDEGDDAAVRAAA